MKNFKNQLSKRSTELSELEYKTLTFFLDNLPKIADLSIDDIAQKLFVSTATITRTTKKLGFDGYREFKFVVSQNINSDSFSIDAEKTQDKELDYKNTLHQTIENLFENIDHDKIVAAARLIHQSNSIEVISMGSSTSNGNDLSYKLLTLNKKSYARVDWDELDIISRNLNKDDLAIIISLSGETEGIIHYGKNLMRNNTPVLSIIGTTNSTLEKITKNTILAPTKPNYIGAIDMSSRVPITIIIDYILETYTDLFFNETPDNKM